MATARWGHTATLLPNGKVLIAGGVPPPGTAGLASAELYDPASGTWAPTGSMTGGRAYHTATLLPDGRVLVAGGYGPYRGDGPNTILASAELYNPASGTWAPTSSMTEARIGHTATLLPNGQVLVAGDTYDGSALAELYDPGSGTWASAGSMTTPRSGNTATLLPNGKVLVAGGNGPSGALASAKVYTPASAPTTPSTPPTPTPLTPIKQAGCVDVAIYGVDENGMGPELRKVADEILHRLPPTFSVLQTGVPYPTEDPWRAYQKFVGTGDVGAYNDDVLSGIEVLVNGRSGFEGIGPLVVRCPHVQIVLLGLSQGAQVVSLALSLAAHPTPVTDRIKAVLLYGSPVRIRGQPINVGDEQFEGILSNPSTQPGGRSALVPSFLWGVTQSFCLRDDPICDFTAGNPANHLSVHMSYGSSLFALRGADFAAANLLSTYGGERTWATPPYHYVALGDSYASGEGTNDYEAATNVSGGDHCHRSPLAYASLLGAVPNDFRACSGDTTLDIMSPKGARGEPSQLNQLDSSVDLVTLSAGGDDLDFPHVFDSCTDQFVIYGVPHSRSDGDCYGAIEQALNRLNHGDGSGPALATRLSTLLGMIAQKAPYARIIVVGYPLMFPPGGCSGGSDGIHQPWQDRLDQAGMQLDTVIQATVRANPLAEYLDPTAAFAGHWVCGRTA